MSSQTFYLKYRPSLISELDNREVAEKLSSYLKVGHVPHAFLLVGHKGTGKTSSARLITKAINCERNLFAGERKGKEKNNSYEPCNKCDICKSITEGNNPDVLEIDAASNTSVDDVRDLRDKVRLSPSISRNKVYIIDEVHMISKSAFNALLKTLEEPPSNTIFILATTEAEKVPDTIVSRCTVIDFKRADANSINKSISRIIKGEKLNIEQIAVDEIIDHAGGSFRDAAKILEQAVYLSAGKEITKDTIKKITGGQSANDIYRFLEDIREERVKEAILRIEDLKEKSVDIRVFVKQILEALHHILLVQVGITSEELDINNIAKKMPRPKLKIITEELEKAYGEMKFSEVPELPIELAILEISSGDENLPSSPKSSQSDDMRQVVHPSVQKNDNHDDFWKNLISKVNAQSKQVAAVLRSCKLKSKNEKELVIESMSKFHYDRLNDAKAIGLIEKCALELVGSSVKIKNVLK